MASRVRSWWVQNPFWAPFLVVVVAIVAVFAVALMPALADPDVQAPSVPQNPAASAGTTGTVAVVTWDASTDDVGVTHYRVWRSISEGGEYSRLESISATPTPTYSDTTGVPGQEYWYKVTALDAAGNESGQSSAAGPVVATWTRAPHATYSDTTQLCSFCHEPHQAASARYIFRDTGQGGGEVTLCYSCHDGTGASTNVKNGAINSFALASGHSLEETETGADLTNQCSSCHSPHKDYETRRFLWLENINDTTVTAGDNSWCFACHNDSQDWYEGSYPSPWNPTRDATGYPVLGTYPGESVYTSSTANGHSTIPTTTPEQSSGACVHCHSSHRGANGYDGLETTFTAPTAATVLSDRVDGTFATSCFVCHGGVVPSGFTTAPTDIKRHVTYDGASDGARSGHRVKTAGGNLPVNAPLPCYDCHNPHGSTRGNASLISDELGIGLSTADASSIREFCFSCHSSSDGKVWDSSSTSYQNVGTDEVEGLRRDGSDGSVLAIPSVNGHVSTDTHSCYSCHGDDYSSASGNNVHNPGAGLSDGGVDCYTCHGTYQTYMEDGTGAKVGSQRTTVYHHVMGGNLNAGATYYDGDYAPGGSNPYPTSGATELFCVTCHVDHDVFNSNKGANLRQNLSVTGTASTDFSTSYTFGGLCTYCHGISFAKDTSNQATSTDDPNRLFTARVNHTRYQNSSHDYSIETTFSDDSSFQANCSKCHNDEQSKSFQTGAYAFGTHYSAARRVISAFGGTVSDPIDSDRCYGCHSGASDGYKTTVGRDWYGSAGASMTVAAESVYGNFGTGMTSTHPVDSGVICENCHNPHSLSATAPLADPDDTYLTASYGTVAEQTAYCLACHDGDAPGAPASSPAYVPATVTVGADADVSTYAARSHWEATGSISAAEVVSCAECHDNHGSTAPRLLGEYDSSDGSNYIGTTEITANNNTVCEACHDSATGAYPAGESDRESGTGYLMDGTWPGMTTYNTAYAPAAKTGSFHSTSTAVWPGTSYAGGDCKNCHDVHGTDNAYDQLRTEDAVGTQGVYGFAADDATFCYNCHDADGPAAGDIERFPGHKISTSGGSLSAGASLPCYDCHNPHGSGSAYGLQVREFGDGAGEIVMGPTRTAADVRHFCFLCHSSDDGQVWDPGTSAYVGVGTDSVEGLRRDGTGGNILALPSVTGHASTDTQSCYTCHGEDYTAATSNNVHNPGAGVSAGGLECYICHSTYQTYMEDGQGTKTGANRASVYHHVMGSATNEGDATFTAGSYPGEGTDVYCLSCHVDHDLFNDSKAANLRASLGASPATAAVDYSTASPYGVCVDCHEVSRTKDTTDQKDDGYSTATPIIGGADFSGASHQYSVESSFGAGATFGADCSKCHNDEQTKQFQTSTNEFGTHWSAERRILAALGATVSEDLAEQHCYRCHSTTSDAIGGTVKSTAGYDWYGTGAMTSTNEKVWKNFNLTGGSSHPVIAAGGSSVECVSCHNAHEVTSSANVSDPDDTYSSHAYSTVSDQTSFCLTCHDGTAPSHTVDGTTYVPRSVTIDAASATSANKSTYAARSHWTANGSIGSGEIVSCAECHDNHGSNAPKLLGAYDSATDTNEIGSTTITANNNTVCQACHNSATSAYPAGESDRESGTGYLTDGTWPGMATYNASPHGDGSDGAVWPGSSYASGDCKNCHDVHGTQNTYDELRHDGSYPFEAGDYSFCFNCHDGSPEEDIAQWYPTGSGGTNTTSDFPGHQIQTSGGNLSVGDGLPCYDCHNPHGSASSNDLQVREFGDATGEISLSTAEGVRKFCLLCHSTSDGKVWDPSTSTSATVGTDEVEGLRRDGTGGSKLALPSFSGHAWDDLTKSCYNCHGDDTTDADSNNVHNPSNGLSKGGVDCYNCHDTFQTYMEDGSGTKTGSSRTTSYHHVLGNGTTEGDNPFGSTAYPGAGTAVYCMSCHVDHDVFNDHKSSNLRGDLASTPTSATTDFSSTSPYGVCVACHSVARVKDTTDQKSDGTANTPAISGTDFDASAHDYAVTSTFDDASSFSANCSKCHTDEQSKDFQTSTYEFGTHWSAERRILSALGASSLTDPMEEEHCYRCHSKASDATGGTTKTVDANDWYGSYTTMSASSTVIYQLMNRTYAHGVGSYSGLHRPSPTDEGSTYFDTLSNKHVECADCHNVHVASPGVHSLGTNAVSNVISGVSGFSWSAGTSTNWNATGSTLTWTTSVSYEYEICLRCHSRANSNLTNWDSSWTDVALEFQTTNQSYHPVFGGLPATDPGANGSSQLPNQNRLQSPWTLGDTMYCSDCHGDDATSNTAMGPHGSARDFILTGYWPLNSSGTAYTISNIDNNILCRDCHVLSGSSLNAVHNQNNHRSSPCYNCHILVPHGGGMSRLIGDGDGTMPSRYAYQGNKSNSFVLSFNKKAAGNYQRQDCYVSAGGCNTHNNASYGGENW